MERELAGTVKAISIIFVALNLFCFYAATEAGTSSAQSPPVAKTDIVVTSDIGEKLIVKPSAVTVTTLSLREILEGNIKLATYFMDTWSDSLESCRRNMHLADWCNETYLPKINKESTEISAWNEQLLALKDIKPALYRVKYRAIHVDLNGIKTAFDYETVRCIGSKVPPGEPLDIVINYGKSTPLPDPESNKVADVLRVKLCKAYARS